MKTPLITPAIAAACIAVLASCATNETPAPTRMQVSASLSPDAPLNTRLHHEVNAYRRSLGKGELQRHAGLDRLARQHSEYLRQHRGSFSLQGRNVSHFGFDGRATYAREAYQMANISENVAASSKTAGSPTQRLISLWKNSRDHHKNMIDDWTVTGVGVVVDPDGMVFATQLFATVSQTQISLRERLRHF
jgi:uncharacterized protein YkwD